MPPCVNARTPGFWKSWRAQWAMRKMKWPAVRRGQADDSSRGKNPGTNDSRKVRRQQARRVTTATPEQSQERSDERALAEAKVRDQCV
jgi:hypothetical protein